MILGLGIDLVEVSRIRTAVGAPSSARFLARCFTVGERAYCDARPDPATHYAARFAAKEAAMKALGVPTGLRFIDIEVARGEGAPTVHLSGTAAAAAERLGVGTAHLALTHDCGIAAATVVLEARGA